MNRVSWAFALLVVASTLSAVDSGAFSGGKFDVTTTGCFCHCASPSAEVVPALAGLPSSWVAATAYPLTVSFTGGPGFNPGPRSNTGGFNLLVRAGSDASAVAGQLRAVNAQAQVQASDRGDATHTAMGNDQTSWSLEWDSPPGPFGDGDVVFRLATNSVNGDGNNGAGGCTDRWNALSVTVPGPADVTPPVLSNVAALPGATQATITWTTDEPANSRVDYGTSDAYGSVRTDAAYVTSHTLSLPALTQQTAYHYHVTSADVAGLTTASVDLHFTTTGDTVPPTAALLRPLRGQLYVNDAPRANPVDANADPIAAPASLRVQTQASDAQSGIDRVEFRVDGQLRATDTTPTNFPVPNTYEWLWPLTTEVPGTHELTSVAVDRLGNTRTVGTAVVVL